MSIRSFRNFPEKKLTGTISRSTGRNNRGIITSGNRGGGHKQKYRFIDFRRSRISFVGLRSGGAYLSPEAVVPVSSQTGQGIPGNPVNYGGSASSFAPAKPIHPARTGGQMNPAIVQRIEYDPNRNADIALICYQNGQKSYILHPLGLKVGSKIFSHESAPVSIGNAVPLQNLPLGVEVHCVELHPGGGGQLARAAGSLAQIIAKEGTNVTIRLPSGEIRLVNQRCWATVGQVGNIESMNRVIGKAGRNRWLGKRPHVRGAAKNPVDHPHGGGEGRNGVGHKYPKTAYGKPALGKKTRRTKKYSDSYILSR
jgi:ribosomal protein L2